MTVERKVGDIEYTLHRNSGQRSLRLHLDQRGHVIVSAPYGSRYSEIDEFVLKSSDWIAKHSGKVSPHDYTTGDFVPFLGKKMTLVVLEGKRSGYDIVDDKIVITAKDRDVEAVKKTIRKLYCDIISRILVDRVPYWCDAIGVKVPEFGVNRAKTKWGVCYTVQKRLYLSYMCATLPYELIDMTVLHEVCHLRYDGHGKDFWALMKLHMPDLEERKTRLKRLSQSGWSMNIV